MRPLRRLLPVAGLALLLASACTGSIDAAGPSGPGTGGSGPDGAGGSMSGTSGQTSTAGSAGTPGDAGTGGAAGGGAAGSGPGHTDPNLLDQGELFTCKGGPVSSPSRLRRIGRPEWRRNAGVGLGNTITDNNPFDPSVNDAFSTYASDETIDDSVLSLYLAMIESAGAGWITDSNQPPVYGVKDGTRHLARVKDDKLLDCIFKDAQPSVDCRRNYVTQLLEDGVFFRTPAADEIDSLDAFAVKVLAAETGVADRTHSLIRITSAAWTMVPALFRPELGEGAPDASGRRRLGNWELAQELTYAISDRAPGAPAAWKFEFGYSAPPEGYFADIAAAARDGSIQKPEVITSLAKAHLGGEDPARLDLIPPVWNDDTRQRRGQYWASDKVAGFFREWLGYGNVASIFKELPGATSPFNKPDEKSNPYEALTVAYNRLMTGAPGAESTLVQQLDDVIARVLTADKDVLRTLLTTREFYVASSTAYIGTSIDGNSTRLPQRIYNLTGEIGTTREDRWVTLPADERAGVLSHPAWLAAHGGNFEDDPSLIRRGKWVRTQLLCDYVPPLSSVTVQAMVGPSAPDKTARDRVVEATSSKLCQGCHSKMNSLGFPFEMYNHAGFLRAIDHDGGPPDGSSLLEDMPDPALNGPVKNAVELSEKLAQSHHVERCFLRQVFRYFMGRDETPADACTLAAMEQAYDTSEGSFQAVLVSLFTSDTFLYRSDAQDETP